MKYIFILLLTTLIFTSCERSQPIDQVFYCSETRLNAPCENKDEEICYKGKCIPKDLKCGGNNDALCETGKECQKDETTQEYSCVEGRCKRGNPDGYCTKEGTVCIQSSCQQPCSTEYPDGGCEDSDKTCFNGICIESNNQCGDSNPNGLCQEGHKCSKKEDGHYDCLRVCSKDFTEGPCLSEDQTCVDGYCLHKDNLCKDKENGECPTGQVCIEKSCKDKCSETSPDGVCSSDIFICINGTCEEKCSETSPTGYCSDEYDGCQRGICKKACGTETNQELDGFCENQFWCKEGECLAPCDVEHPSGICEKETQWCDDGVCTNKCGEENGKCEDENQQCRNNVCINWCSPTYPTGACEENYVCQNTQCTEAACSVQFPNGYCQEDGKRCVDNFCKNECSSTTPSGWCEGNDNYCYQNSCKAISQIPCGELNGTYCANSNDECINEICILKPCSVNFDGRCEQDGYICNTDTGSCEEAPMCSDLRPTLCQDGENPNETGCILNASLPNSSTFGACCSSDTDCGDDGDISNIRTIRNKCVNDNNSIGPYCNKIGENACSSDSDCNDPYDGNTEDSFYCSTYYESGVVDISFCERVKENCTRTYKGLGEACNEECGNAECMQGTYCIDGICTYGCNEIGDNSDCFPVHGKQLECSNYFGKRGYPGYPYSIYSNICRNTCSSNNDCSSPENECNQFFNMSSISNTETPHFLTCGKKIDGLASGEICTDHKACSSGICLGLNSNTESGKCGTEPCSEHEDCGANGYCDYSISLTTVFVGMCVELAAARGGECTSTNDCSQEAVTIGSSDRYYKCIKSSDKNDVAKGICGIFEKIGSIPSGEAQPCNRNNRYCESNMCINSTEGYTCREFCSESSECSELNGVKQICQRIKLRDGTTMTDANKEVYGGVCIPTTGTPSLSNCETASCPNGETCILNPVNLQENPDRPWVFSVEYLCIENGNGAPNGTSCENDNECQSNLCSKLSSQCTVACTIDNQCLGIGAGGANKTCNLSSPANNDDDNPDNWILGGTCE